MLISVAKLFSRPVSETGRPYLVKKAISLKDFRFLFFFLHFFVAGLLEPANAGNRVALVVGVAKYKFVPELANTINDANKMAESLKRLNFDVTLVTNPSRPEFETALMEYGNRINNAEASIFFYAGHALEVSGRNWLLPADAKLNSARDLRFQAIDVQGVLDQTQSSRASLLFLDACRNNPFSEILSRGTRGQPSRGLAPIDPATGIYVAFATAPGQVASDGTGANSPFTEALLKHIETPGLEIRQLMNRVRADVRTKTGDQIPWEQSALEGDFYFSPPKPSPTIGIRTSQDVAPRSPSIDNEGLFWDSIRNSVDPEDFAAYLKQFPTGIYSDLAKNRVRILQRRVGEPQSLASPPRAEAAPRDEAQRVETQKKADEAAEKAEADRKASEAAKAEAQRKAAEAAAAAKAEAERKMEAQRLEAQRKADEAAARPEAQRKAAEAKAAVALAEKKRREREALGQNKTSLPPAPQIQPNSPAGLQPTASTRPDWCPSRSTGAVYHDQAFPSPYCR